jgi:hypothetical protein
MQTSRHPSRLCLLVATITVHVLMLRAAHADPLGLDSPETDPLKMPRLVISELVTDPQSDHSESSGGNGVAFDAIPGTGSITSSDEFIELRFLGDTQLDLRGFSILFIDTTPSEYIFGKTKSGVLRFSPGSSLGALSPGGFVLLGNPPGALNNTIKIVLRNPYGVLYDLWDLDGTTDGPLGEASGNATGGDDEAVVRLPNAEWYFHASITPLLETPVPSSAAPAVPEPSCVWLFALSCLGVCAANRRRARCAKRRTPSRWPDSDSPRPASPEAAPESRDRCCVAGRST